MKQPGPLQAKAFIMIVAGVLMIGGASAAFASTSIGRHVLQSTVHTHATMTAAATHTSKHDGQKAGKSNQKQRDCPGLSTAQKLATQHHLSSADQGDAVKAICALHQGTFKGTTSSGVTVAAGRVYGFGEIDQLLTSAQYLASHDQANAGGKLTDTNVSGYLAAAINTCGASPLETCLKTTLAASQPGKGGHGNGTGSGDKPRGTLPPHMPRVTPTPHH
jgi:hypothetical protein